MRVCGHVCVRVRVCAHLCKCMISKISILFKILANSLNTHSLYTRFLPRFFSCGTIFLVILLHATWRNLERLIFVLNRNYGSSHKSRGMRCIFIGR